MKIKILIIISILVVIFLQYKEINNNSNTYDILQSENPKKDKFEDIINRKCITVFLGIVKDLEEIKEINYNEIKKMDRSNKNKLEKILCDHFQYYLVPMCLSYNFTLSVENKGFKSPIIKSDSYRYLFAQIDGRKKLILFNNLQSKYLYIKNKKSQVDFWNQDLKKFPDFSKSKYIEILVSNGQMIYIPPDWWFCYENIDNSIYVNCKSESIFSYFLRM